MGYIPDSMEECPWSHDVAHEIVIPSKLESASAFELRQIRRDSR